MTLLNSPETVPARRAGWAAVSARPTGPARREGGAVPGSAALAVCRLAQFLEDSLGYNPLGSGLRLMPRGADAPGASPYSSSRGTRDSSPGGCSDPWPPGACRGRRHLTTGPKHALDLASFSATPRLRADCGAAGALRCRVRGSHPGRPDRTLPPGRGRSPDWRCSTTHICQLPETT